MDGVVERIKMESGPERGERMRRVLFRHTGVPER